MAQVAAQIGIEPEDLDEAIQVYAAAGYAALERRAERDWYQIRVQFPEWAAAESVAAGALGLRLDQLLGTGDLTGWWFLRKHPCWRLRLRGPAAAEPGVAIVPLLDDLVAAGAIRRWWSTVYEPEVAAFGGPHATQIVHELFCADTHGVLEYLRQPVPGLGRRELSMLLCNVLMRSCNLEWYERGDVFDRVARLRPSPPDTETERVRPESASSAGTRARR